MDGGGGIAQLRFPQSDRVKTRIEIDKVFKSGTRFSCKGMRVHVLHNGMSRTRIALVPVRSYSGAVDRNRAKRVVREAWRLQRPRFNSGFDCVVVLFPGFDTLAERAAQLLLLLRQAGCLAKSC